MNLTDTSWLPSYRFTLLSLLAIASIATFLMSIATLAYQLHFTVGYNQPVPIVSLLLLYFKLSSPSFNSPVACLFRPHPPSCLDLPLSDHSDFFQTTKNTPSAENRAHLASSVGFFHSRNGRKVTFFNSRTLFELWWILYLRLSTS